MRTIALEEHFATPGYLDGPGQDLKNAALKFEGRATRLIEGLTDIGAKRMAAMDAAGIDMLELGGGHPVALDLQAVFRVALIIDVERRVGKIRSAASPAINLSTSDWIVASPTRSL